MQKTPWFHEEQADVMLNYLPLRNVLTGIKAVVKNKALPDSAAPPIWALSLFFSFSLSPSQTWPYQGWSHMSSLADAIHPKGTPCILRRLDPRSVAAWIGGGFRENGYMYVCG